MSRPHSTYHAAPWGSSSSSEHKPSQHHHQQHHHHQQPHLAHSAYSASAGPSTYRALSSGHAAAAPSHHAHHSDPWAHRSASAAPGPSSPLPPTFASQAPSANPSPEQPVIRTTHVTADGTTIYAATGRKRKRLQKACVACHKAKRRCDGGLPCSNCDFSGRTCCYSDANGKMVIPTARVANEAGQSSGSSAGHSNANLHPSEALTPAYTAVSASSPNGSDLSGRPRANTMSSKSSPMSIGNAGLRAEGLLTIDDVAPERRRDLISIFFSQIHPFSCVMDEISFLRDLSTSEVPSYLLMAMFALAARFEQGISEAERERRFAQGEGFARSARRMLQDEDQDGFTLLDRPDVDLSLTLCFLSAHELGMGRLQRALSYSNDAVRINATLKLADGQLPPARKNAYGRDSFSSSSWPRRATCERLVLLAWTLDMTIAALAAQSSTVRRSDVLAAARNFGTSGDETRDDVTKSFARLAEIATVFGLVIDANEPCSKGEDALQSWAAALVVEHKFDDYNMKSASRLLEEPEASAASHRAWFWAQMHLIAECSVFLMEARRSGAPQADRGQQKAALDNIHLILSVLSITGRRNLFAFPALLLCTQYSGRGASPDASRWWATARQCWNLGEQQIGEAARFFVRPASDAPSPTRGSSTGAESLRLPRLSSSSVGSNGNLPSIARLPLPSLRLSPAHSRNRSSVGSDDGLSSGSSPDSSAISPRSAPLEVGAEEYVAARGSRSPPLTSQIFAKDPRTNWSPISSLRGEKRGLSAISS
ncbi:Zn(2)-C6 fungal-type DNA-binding domain protein [Kalmanozyma brasiliensis GHG001]|uniref:Zn(2)-C6 fungal-type domain-containing protein n=1 Tax=Kalmanozyma brasiliensis (strain GHG001) TaxID=1365824 RepID=V5EUF6_KALBG|nr:Zn(2)-C6 fungal-type DNA-binding domain protein [Kalmanozyma brasiliensis GHG001]EST09010.1 Zn(2)-C6 fungal-type DNA-binding domain protein [Kalmanozyma brasiliensis GHG001]